MPTTAAPRYDTLARSAITAGPIRRTLFVLALPVLGEQMLNFVVGLFDTVLAGRISPAATSAVGFAAYVGWLASMLAMLVATGTTALVARHEGARDHDEANRFANQSLTLGCAVGMAVLALIFAIAPWLAKQQHMTGETYAITVHYLRMDAIGHAFMSITIVGSAALRGAGNMRTPMFVFAVVNAFNIVVSLSLVYGLGPLPPLGVSGIVGGTVSARTLGALIMIVVLARGRAGLRLRPRELMPDRRCVTRILRIGIPAAGDGAVMWAGHFMFLTIIASLAVGEIGRAYYAAHMIAVRTEALTYLPAVAWGTAAATMIGQAIGAADPARARRVGHEAVFQCGCLAVLVAAAFYVGARGIYAVMSTDALVRTAGVGPFRILALLTPLLVVSIVYVHGLRGAGDTRYPLLITMAGTLVIRLVLGWLFGVHYQWGLLGAWMGMFCDMIWRAGAASIRYAGGRWLATAV
ncbi:MAG: MATE family efflux transporter [Phycisphaerae bacterium]